MIAALLAACSRLVSGATVEWHCDPDASVQRIYFSNHSSHLDVLVIWAVLPPRLRRLTRPVAGRDYWERGAVRRYLATRVFHAVLIDRGVAGRPATLAAARASIHQMTDAIGDRHSLVVFPEGTRSTSGEVAHFKSGLYYLARARPDAELIPVRLENLNRILPKGEVLPVPMLCRVIFGPVLRPDAGLHKHAFLAQAREALTRLGETP